MKPQSDALTTAARLPPRQTIDLLGSDDDDARVLASVFRILAERGRRARVKKNQTPVAESLGREAATGASDSDSYEPVSTGTLSYE